MKPAISIVVPVYHVEECLADTLECLVHQTMDNLEVILVDDGSEDHSGIICDDYAARYPFVRVVHKKNEGVSVARNTGIELAAGEYVTFIDADDLISRRFCEILYRAAKDHNADIAMCEWRESTPEQAQDGFENAHQVEDVLLTRDQALYLATDLNHKAGISVCTKIFRRSIIENCRFTPKVPLGEDIEFVFAAMSRCERIVFCQRVLYLYMMRQNSAMHKPYRAEKENLLRNTYDRILSNPVWTSDEAMHRRMIAYRACVCELTILNKMIRDGSVDREMIVRIREYLRKSLPDILKSQFPMMKKIQISLAAVSFTLYRTALKFLGNH